MTVQRLSISVSPELDASLRSAARKLRTDISRLVEALLRESPVVHQEIEAARGAAQTKKGRDLDKILALADVANAQWEQRLRSGTVKLPDR